MRDYDEFPTEKGFQRIHCTCGNYIDIKMEMVRKLIERAEKVKCSCGKTIFD